MRWMPMIIGLALGLVPAVQAPAQEDQTAPREYYVPPGDPAAGREAFRALKCYSCHRVAHDAMLPAPVAAQPGPVLQFDPQADSAEKVATMILSPSHTIAGGFGEQTPEDVQFSRMGDFSDSMTVRQLKDIVSYLRSKS